MSRPFLDTSPDTSRLFGLDDADVEPRKVVMLMRDDRATERLVTTTPGELEDLPPHVAAYARSPAPRVPRIRPEPVSLWRPWRTAGAVLAVALAGYAVWVMA